MDGECAVARVIADVVLDRHVETGVFQHRREVRERAWHVGLAIVGQVFQGCVLRHGHCQLRSVSETCLSGISAQVARLSRAREYLSFPDL